MQLRSVLLAAACAVGLASCGTASAGPPTTTTVAKFTYGMDPSVSAKMICRHETIADIARVLGVPTTKKPEATWVRHRYTCPYLYTDGSMTVSVKELPTLAATLAYVQGLRVALGDVGSIVNVGQQGFSTTDGSAVTRKDNKVLLVDVKRLPASFGVPATTRDEVALTVTDIILQCWRGD